MTSEDKWLRRRTDKRANATLDASTIRDLIEVYHEIEEEFERIGPLDDLITILKNINADSEGCTIYAGEQ